MRVRLYGIDGVDLGVATLGKVADGSGGMRQVTQIDLVRALRRGQLFFEAVKDEPATAATPEVDAGAGPTAPPRGRRAAAST